jgi:predicted TIM-barrel fold metal-dependent hydrolase
MSWNGCKVIDIDTHVYEKPEEMYQDYIDPSYKEPYELLRKAIKKQVAERGSYSLFGNRSALIEPVEAGRPLGVRDTFGMWGQRGSGKRIMRGERPVEVELIRPEVSWDAKARVEDMDRALIDINVIFPTHVSSYCALHDVGFENALYRAYYRWVSDFCSQAPQRLKWTLVANMRDLSAAIKEIQHWANQDPNLVGIHLSPRSSDGKLLDNPDFYPLYEVAQELELPILIHPGTGRPPFIPGTFELDGYWFLIQGLLMPWAGMTAMGALIGGGIFDLFPKLRIGVLETSGGWVPIIADRLDAHYMASPSHVPNLTRMPHEVVRSGNYFHAIDTWERTLQHCVESLGEEIWLFSTDYPHKGTQWPNGVEQIVSRPGLSESAKQKVLGKNAMSLCPRLRD